MHVGFTMDFRNSENEPWARFWEDRMWLFQQAEAMGFDYLSVQEHFFTRDAYGPSLPVFQTLLAERTKQVRIGSYLYVLPLHNAAQLAQETAVLDQLCEGRLDVTVGAGHRPLEYYAFGLDPKTRPSRMEEGLAVLKQAWTGQPFTFKGKYYDLQDIVVTPEPFQKPHPPLWIAATSVAAAARAGRHGAHLHGAAVDPEVHAAYRSALVASGHDPSKMRVSNPWSITVTDENPEKVWQKLRPFSQRRWSFYKEIRAEMGDKDLEYGLPPGEDAFRDFELIGKPDEVLATLKPFQAQLGLTDIIHSGPAAGEDIRGEAYKNLKRFAEDVLPVLKGW